MGGGRCQHTLAGSFYKRHAVRRLDRTRTHAQTLPSDCLSVQGFRGSFIPLPGCFSPFPHGTGSLSVARSMRALEGGPPSFPQGFSCPVVLRYIAQQPCRLGPLRDSHPLRWAFPDPSRQPDSVAVNSLAQVPAMPSQPRRCWLLHHRRRFGRQPGSLATTTGLSSPRLLTQMRDNRASENARSSS
jgi:hypothetical protein